MLRNLLSILMITVFLALVLVSRNAIGVLNYWLLFAFLFILAAMYLYLRFYVSKKQCAKLIKSDDFYSVSVALVPEKVDGEFIYGRLVAYNSMLLLYGVGKKHAELKWSEELSNLESLSFQKLTTGRKGFVISTENRGDFEFVCHIKDSEKPTLISKFGLEIDD